MANQDNAAFINRMYAAFSSGDIETILDSITDDVEWVNYGPSTIPYAGSWRGRSQVGEFFQAMGSSTTGGKVVPETVIADGDKVIATGRYTATVRNTGAEIDVPIAHEFTIRNGKVTKWVGLSDTAKVAEAHTRAAAAGH
jgi:uncharacterized protein